MKNIPVDEGFAFDFLAILIVKQTQTNSVELNNYVEIVTGSLIDQMGFDLFYKIKKSDEWADLFVANLKVFKLVDNVKKDPCIGADVDRANYNRFLCKKKLQEKFFPNEKTNEVKIGY